MWSCWECVHKVASVTRILKGEYGFAINDNDETIYFHLNRRVRIWFDGSDYPVQGNFDNNIVATADLIGADSVIIYQEFAGERGPKALWWAFESEYFNVKAQIEARLRYRLVERNGREALSRLQEQPKYRILWEGKNLGELNGHRVINDHDPMAMYACYFQYFNGEGWALCADPRETINGNRQGQEVGHED